MGASAITQSYLESQFLELIQFFDTLKTVPENKDVKISNNPKQKQYTEWTCPVFQPIRECDSIFYCFYVNQNST